MRHAISKHVRDFVAILVLIAIAVFVGGYILANQRVRFPLIEETPFELKADFENAQGVTPGQGQTVRVAGMRIGDVKTVELENGRAVVTFAIDPEHREVVRRGATALLRPRTGLKDMFIEVDPGRMADPPMRENELIPAQNTAPDVNADEILSALDTDTRDYLKLLINGAGQGLKGRGSDLREVFRRLGPLHRDLAAVNGAIAERREALARLVNNYGSTIEELSKKDRELTKLVSSSRQVFGALAQEDQGISSAVHQLPGTLRQLERTLVRVEELGNTLRPSLQALRPAVRKIDDANREIRPAAIELEPILRKQIRPFVQIARPYVRDLRPAARDIGAALPDLRESFFELNRFFNIAAYNPGGAEKLTGDATKDLARDEGLLFWLAWVSQNGNSIFSTGDAAGPYRRIIVVATCTTIQGLVKEEPASEIIGGLTGLLNDAQLCPKE